jgi:hypothetical protein
LYPEYYWIAAGKAIFGPFPSSIYNTLFMKIIETQLSEKEFIKANMVLLAQKRITWIAPAIGLLLLMSNLVTRNKSSSLLGIFLVPIIYLIIFSAILPLLTWFRAKKLYNARSSRAKEKINYEFLDNQLEIRGESFNATLSWDKIHKVTATKNWVFIWQNSQYANCIPKTDIWEGEIMKLREILNDNKVKHNLK